MLGEVTDGEIQWKRSHELVEVRKVWIVWPGYLPCAS